MAQSKIKNSLEPILRFKEFTDFWSKTKLSDIAEFHKGKGISKSDIIADGKLECIRYGELYTTYSELINIVVSRTNIPSNELILSEYNDVIIPASGETNIDIATASCVLKSGVALSGDLNIIRSKMDGVFISFYLNNKRKFDIARLAQGVSVVHLYSSQLKALKLNIPSLPEQQKIASFLSAVDEKIQLLTRKKELLENYKKGAMQQLFSQKLRFKDENGKDFPDWEEKRLGEISKITTGSSNRQDSNLDGEFTFFDRSQDIRTSNIFLFDTEAIIVPGEGQEFIPKYFKGKFDLHQRTYAIMNFHPNIGRFLYYNLSFNSKHLLSNAVGSTVKSLRLPMFEKMPILLPELKEQQKIASFLSAIDEKIEAVNQQITQSQTFKKALLQQMFV